MPAPGVCVTGPSYLEDRCGCSVHSAPLLHLTESTPVKNLHREEPALWTTHCIRLSVRASSCGLVADVRGPLLPEIRDNQSGVDA